MYKTTDLAPIHDNCNCTVLPIVTLFNGDEFDPGKVVNDDDLDIPAAFTDANWDTRSRMSNVKFTKGDDGKLHVDENTQPQWYRDGQPDPAATPETQTGGGGGGGKNPPIERLDSPGDHPRKHDITYSGSLGSQGDHTVPTVNELLPYLAPSSDKWAEFDDDEKVIAGWLNDHLGIKLWSLKVRPGKDESTPEALLDDLTESMELKTASSRRSLSEQARAGRKQSRRVAIWVRLTEANEVQRGIGSALSLVGDQLAELVVIFNHGRDYVHWNHE